MARASKATVGMPGSFSVDDEVRAQIDAAATALRKAGAKVSHTARRDFDPAERTITSTTRQLGQLTGGFTAPSECRAA